MWQALRILAQEQTLRPEIEPIDVSRGIATLIWGLAIIAGVPIAIWLGKKAINAIALKRMKSYTEDLLNEAAQYEKSGEFVSAGLIYEKLKDLRRAATLYEKGRDFQRAAEIYEAIQMPLKAKEMYEALGEREKAARAAISAGEFMEAARIYKEAGLLEKAAQVLEDGGSLLAAARQWREAGNYLRAAELLRQGGMPSEAADMYKISLAEVGEISHTNLDRYYKYAEFLEAAGRTQEAEAVLKNISLLDPDYKDISQRLGQPVKTSTNDSELIESHRYSEETPSQVEPLKREVSLKTIMGSKIEPRYALRLWVSVLKALNQRLKEGSTLPEISAENIFIDSENNIRFASEGLGSVPLDLQALGTILYEMLTKEADTKSPKRPSEITPDVPEWLDELILRCIDRERPDRFETIEDVFLALKRLTKKAH